MALHRASTTAIGKAFERHSIKFLNHHMNMCVREVGGANDGGVDIRGWWFLPPGAGSSQGRTQTSSGIIEDAQSWKNELEEMRESFAGFGKASKELDTNSLNGDGGGLGQTLDPGPAGEDGEGILEGLRRLRVVGQCKAEGKPVGTKYIRELEGVMSHFQGRGMSGSLEYDLTGRPVGNLAPGTVAILISRSGFTSNATVRAWRSPSPMMLVHLPGGSVVDPNERDDGVGPEGIGMRVTGVWLNPALSGLRGLLGGHVEVRREILPPGPPVGDGKEVQTPKDQWRVWYSGKRLGRVGPTIEEVEGKQ